MRSLIWLLCFLVIGHDVADAQSVPWYALNGSDVRAARSLNPAFLQNPHFESSLGIGSISMDYNNNLGYFIDKSFMSLPIHFSEISVPELQFRKLGFNPALGIDRELRGYEMKLNETDLARMYFSTSLSIAGPSYFRRLKSGMIVGITTGSSFIGGLKNYPAHMTYGPYRRYSSGDRMPVPEFSGTADGRMYVGVNIAREFALSSGTRLGVGANIRYLGGLMHFELSNDEAIREYFFRERDRVEVSNMRLDYKYSHSNANDLHAPWIRGNGMGGDLGIYFESKLKSQQFSSIRGGIALNNLGFVRYSQGLRSGSFNIYEPTEISFGKFDTLIGFDQLVDSFEYIVLKNPVNEHLQNRGGTIYTLPSLNMAFSFGLREYGKIHFFASSPLTANNPEAFQIGVIPELTFNLVNIITPFSYNRWTGFRLGAGLNFGFLTFGTDDVRTFFKRERLQSGSFYCAVHINYFSKSKNGKKK